MQRYRTLYQNASKYLEEKFWTGSRRYNASHFYYGNKTLNIPDEKSCFHGFSSIKQFRSSVILTRKNTTYFAVRFTFCLFYNFFFRSLQTNSSPGSIGSKAKCFCWTNRLFAEERKILKHEVLGLSLLVLLGTVVFIVPCFRCSTLCLRKVAADS